LAIPARRNEIEVSIFGPGLGEGILVHLGNEQWARIDSAKYQKTPWALWYLEQLKLTAERISLIVATHWHSDHVDGLSEIVKKSSKARFVCSNALRLDEFKRIISRYIQDDSEKIRAPLRELQAIFDTFYSRCKHEKGAIPPTLASAFQLLFRSDLSDSVSADIWSLSPSPQDVLDAKAEFSSLFVPPEEFASGISPIGQNSACVVILFRIGEELILLGSDLENKSNRRTGWNAIVGSSLRPPGRPSVFKVPHHGSAGAFSQPLWDTVIHEKAIAVVTPYVPSGLPRASELDRLRALGRDIYVTAFPGGSVGQRSWEIEKAMNEVAMNRSS
jgi:beta-lactamase superfamily II metal-dependent hydrolase